MRPKATANSLSSIGLGQPQQRATTLLQEREEGENGICEVRFAGGAGGGQGEQANNGLLTTAVQLVLASNSQ